METISALDPPARAATFLQGDTSVSADMTRAVADVVDAHGRLDVWINNAAIGVGGDVVDTSESDWDRVMAVNAKGYFLGCKVAITQMLKQAPMPCRVSTAITDDVRGRIINISSQHGMIACPGDLAYGVGKACSVYMTRQIANNYAKDGIMCNAVAPGKIVTGYDSDDRAYSLRRTPAPRLGCPNDIAKAVLWLASPTGASSFVQGINLMVDGGWTAS